MLKFISIGIHLFDYQLTKSFIPVFSNFFYAELISVKRAIELKKFWWTKLKWKFNLYILIAFVMLTAIVHFQKEL